MNITPVLAYIVASSLCLGIFYLFYRLFLYKDTGFKAIRIYLAGAVVVSFILPFLNLSVNLDLPSIGTAEYFDFQHETNAVLNDSPVLAKSREMAVPAAELSQTPEIKTTSSRVPIHWSLIVALIYLPGCAFLLTRLIKQVIVICICYLRSENERIGSSFIIRNSKFDIPFTFFNWIFIPENMEPGEEMDEIVQHEMVHARQLHSADVLVAELLTALMWFNPLIWMMKNSVQLVHEYLADEGAINEGLDKVTYQALLVNQAAEGRLVPLSSRFSQSIIKKRIIMMSKTKSNPFTKFKYLGIIPVVTLLILGIACAKTQKEPTAVNGEQATDEILSVVVPVKMNILYLGVENPVAVAVSGYRSEDLELGIDNGRIEGQDGNYIVMPAKTGYANITIYHDGTEIGTKIFRVKPIPDPYARVGEKRDGLITKEELLDAGGINAYVNIEYDIQFRPVSFVMSATISGFTREEASSSDRITDSQIDLINSLKADQKLYFEEIKAVGPDGAIRELGPMVFIITE